MPLIPIPDSSFASSSLSPPLLASIPHSTPASHLHLPFTKRADPVAGAFEGQTGVIVSCAFVGTVVPLIAYVLYNCFLRKRERKAAKELKQQELAQAMVMEHYERRVLRSLQESENLEHEETRRQMLAEEEAQGGETTIGMVLIQRARRIARLQGRPQQDTTIVDVTDEDDVLASTMGTNRDGSNRSSRNLDAELPTYAQSGLVGARVASSADPVGHGRSSRIGARGGGGASGASGVTLALPLPAALSSSSATLSRSSTPIPVSGSNRHSSLTLDSISSQPLGLTMTTAAAAASSSSSSSAAAFTVPVPEGPAPDYEASVTEMNMTALDRPVSTMSSAVASSSANGEDTGTGRGTSTGAAATTTTTTIASTEGLPPSIVPPSYQP